MSCGRVFPQPAAGLRVSFALPPMYAEIDALFHVKGKPVIFCWGTTIFNPMRIKIPSVLFAHERVHSGRQGTSLTQVHAWWKQYLRDPEFRLAEELPAHVAEFQAYRRLHGPGQRTTQYLEGVAERLSSPLYGGVISQDRARHQILTGETNAL